MWKIPCHQGIRNHEVRNFKAPYTISWSGPCIQIHLWTMNPVTASNSLCTCGRGKYNIFFYPSLSYNLLALDPTANSVRTLVKSITRGTRLYSGRTTRRPSRTIGRNSSTSSMLRYRSHCYRFTSGPGRTTTCGCIRTIELIMNTNCWYRFSVAAAASLNKAFIFGVFDTWHWVIERSKSSKPFAVCYQIL